MRNVLCTLAALLSISAAASPDNSSPAVESPLLPGAYVGEEHCDTVLHVAGQPPVQLSEPACASLVIGDDGLPVGDHDGPDASAQICDVAIESSGVTVVKQLDVLSGLVIGRGISVVTYVPLDNNRLFYGGEIILPGTFEGQPATLAICCSALLDREE